MCEISGVFKHPKHPLVTVLRTASLQVTLAVNPALAVATFCQARGYLPSFPTLAATIQC